MTNSNAYGYKYAVDVPNIVTFYCKTLEEATRDFYRFSEFGAEILELTNTETMKKVKREELISFF